MTLTIELWHLVVITTAMFWIPAMRIPVGHHTNPFNGMAAIALFIVPVLFWSGFFIGRLTA